MPPTLLRRAVLKPVAGYDYTQPSSYSQFVSGFPSNMRYVQGELRKREGSKKLGSVAVPGDNGIMHLATYETKEEIVRLLRMSKTKVEMYNASTAAWDDKTGASSFSGGDADYFDHAIAENKLIGTNYVNVPWTYADGDAARAALGGSPPKFKFCEYLSPYLVVGFVESGDNKHQKVQWPDSGDITAWAAGNASSALLNHDGNPLRGLKNITGFCAAYLKNSIYLGRKVDTSDVIKWDLQTVGTGLMNHRSVVEHNGLHYLMALNDFVIFNGVRPQSIGGPIREFVFPQRNANKDSSHFALHVKDYEEIWFFVTMIGSDYPNTIWKYNYRHNWWYKDTCLDCRSAVQWFNQASVTIDDLVGTIDAQANKIDDYLSVTNAPSYVYGAQDGHSRLLDRSISNDDGVAVDAAFDTIDFVGDTFEKYKRWLQFDFWAKGNSVRVLYSTEEGINWKEVPGSPYTLDGTWKPYRAYFDIVSEKVRFRFLNNTTDETFWIRQYYPYYLTREEQNA